MAKTLVDALIELNGQPLVEHRKACIWNPKRRAWLSGVPYLWSGFAERAYVASENQALSLIENYPDDLRGCEVKAR